MTDATPTSNLLTQMEAWIASSEGQRYACTRQYPHPGYACDRDAKCVGCLMVSAALELKKRNQAEAEDQGNSASVAGTPTPRGSLPNSLGTTCDHETSPRSVAGLSPVKALHHGVSAWYANWRMQIPHGAAVELANFLAVSNPFSENGSPQS